MKALLEVGKGSDNEPAFVVLKYLMIIVLLNINNCYKGVTYDWVDML